MQAAIEYNRRRHAPADGQAATLRSNIGGRSASESRNVRSGRCAGKTGWAGPGFAGRRDTRRRIRRGPGDGVDFPRSGVSEMGMAFARAAAFAVQGGVRNWRRSRHGGVAPARRVAGHAAEPQLAYGRDGTIRSRGHLPPLPVHKHPGKAPPKRKPLLPARHRRAHRGTRSRHRLGAARPRAGQVRPQGRRGLCGKLELAQPLSVPALRI